MDDVILVLMYLVPFLLILSIGGAVFEWFYNRGE